MSSPTHDIRDGLSRPNAADAHEDRDVEKTEGALDVNEVTYDSNELDPVDERKLTRKYDIFIIPVLGVSVPQWWPASRY
jgi:hypothetical protein